MKSAVPNLLFIMLLFSAVAFAASVEMIEPVVASVSDGDVVNLGTIGPGQTLAITVNGKAVGKDGLQANWGILGVMELPNGWSGFDSKVYAQSMRSTIKAEPTAADGNYMIKFKLTECESVNEECEAKQGLGSVTFFGRITVSRDVLSTSAQIASITTGVGQPARYPLVIENKGSASDVFEISAEGVPAWDIKKTVHVAAGQTHNTFYEIAVDEEKEYAPTIIVKSLSSDELKHSHDVKLNVKSDVIGDIKASKNGILLFPIALEPLYTVVGLLGYFMG